MEEWMTTDRIKIILTGAAVIAISLLYFFIDARETDIFPRCPFYLLTGLFCPGCGSQRAVSALLHLDIGSALRYNSLLVASLPLIMYSAYVALMNAFGSRKLQQKLVHSPWFIRVVAIVVIAFAILRNLPVHPFHLLAPGD